MDVRTYDIRIELEELLRHHGNMSRVAKEFGLSDSERVLASRIADGGSVLPSTANKIRYLIGLPEKRENRVRWSVPPELDKIIREAGISRLEIVLAGMLHNQLLTTEQATDWLDNQ